MQSGQDLVQFNQDVAEFSQEAAEFNRHVDKFNRYVTEFDQSLFAHSKACSRGNLRYCEASKCFGQFAVMFGLFSLTQRSFRLFTDYIRLPRAAARSLEAGHPSLEEAAKAAEYRRMEDWADGAFTSLALCQNYSRDFSARYMEVCLSRPPDVEPLSVGRGEVNKG
jgi:hypothetical protein